MTARAGRRRRVAIVVLAAGIAVAGCSSGNRDEARQPAGSAAPTTTADPGAPGPTDPAGVTGFNVYFTTQCPKPDVQRDPCLVAVGERRTTTEPDVLTAAVRTLMDGPNAVEDSIGLTGHIAKRVQFQGVELDPATGIATVRFNRFFETANTRPQVAQVVYTLTQFPDVERVKFLIDGEDNGATGVLPLDRADLADRTPVVFVDSPWLNAAVGRRFTLRGTASGATAPVPWQLVDGAGTVLASGNALLGSAPPAATPGIEPPPPFETVVVLGADVPAGPAELVVGSGESASRTPVTVG